MHILVSNLLIGKKLWIITSQDPFSYLLFDQLLDSCLVYETQQPREFYIIHNHCSCAHSPPKKTGANMLSHILSDFLHCSRQPIKWMSRKSFKNQLKSVQTVIKHPPNFNCQSGNKLGKVFIPVRQSTRMGHFAVNYVK